MTIRWIALITTLALASGCGVDNTLSGSLSESISLEANQTIIARNAEALQVTYLVNRDVFVDVVIRLSVSLKGVAVKPGAKIDLAGEYEPGHPRAVVSHAPGGEPTRVLPRIKRGDLSIASGGEIGKPMRGDFSVLFETEGGDFGGGRTLSGIFAGDVADAGFGPLP